MKPPSEKYLVPSTAHLGAGHQNTTALGGAILLLLRDIDTRRAPNFGTGTPHPISTFLAPNLLNTFGTVMARNVLNIGTVMAQRHHLPLGTLLALNCLLYGTCLALSGCFADTKKNLLLSGTFLAPILFHYMNHQSQACSCNWKYSLKGEVFLVTALQAWLGPDYRTVCDYFYVKQLDNHWALWREAWCEGIQLTKIWEYPLSYIKTIARESFHSWGVMTGGEQVPEPTLWAPKFLHLPGTCLAPNYNFSNGTILTFCRHQNIMAPPWHQIMI